MIDVIAEMILYDHTLAFGPKSATTHHVCLTCAKKVDPDQFQCPDCKWPMCNEACAKSKVHKVQECPILAKSQGEISLEHYRAIAPIRLLIIKETDPDFYLKFKGSTIRIIWEIGMNRM